MMLVPVRLGVSKIHGLGIYATTPILKGTKVWEYREPIDWRIYGCHRGGAQVDDYITRFAYRVPGSPFIEVPGDLACFWNHSETPNCDDGGETWTVAARDITPNEELSIDYRTFTDGTLCGAFLK